MDDNSVVTEKLVRDKIPEIIMESGKSISLRRELDSDKSNMLLWRKFDEELCEFGEAETKADKIEEICDIVTVLCYIADVGFEVINDSVKRKYCEKGGFEKMLVMETKYD